MGVTDSSRLKATLRDMVFQSPPSSFWKHFSIPRSISAITLFFTACVCVDNIIIVCCCCYRCRCRMWVISGQGVLVIGRHPCVSHAVWSSYRMGRGETMGIVDVTAVIERVMHSNLSRYIV